MSTQVTYGNIRKPTRPGLWGMSTVQTGVVLLSMFVLIFLAATGNLGLILAWVGLVVLFSVPLLIPTRDGRNVYQRTHARWVFDRSRRRARNIYKAGPTGHVADGKCRLPGLLAASELTEHRDAYDQPFGLLAVPATKHYSVVLEANATGNELVDLATVDQQVAHWGAWLAALGNETGIAGASVTVETAPDSGLRLRRNVEDNVADGAPEFGLAVLAEIVDTYPAGAAQIQTRITLTFSGAASEGIKARGTPEMATEIGNRLPMLLGSLRATGAGSTPRACSAADIVDATRVAYDPSVAMRVEQARAEGGTGLTWDEAGPVYAQAEYDYYRHDRGFSKTWQMAAPPRGVFYATSLERLLQPHRDIARKRVTVLYRPEDPIHAAAAVEQDINTAHFNASQKRRASARSAADLAAAKKQAQEEALGAGLVRFGLVVTATVTSLDQLPLAAKTVRALSAPARLRMREALANQDVAFASALPLGLVLPHHMFLPPSLRDAM